MHTFFDITCPVTKLPFAEYTYGDDISKIVDWHMAECHKDWIKTAKLTYLPIDGADCPVCSQHFSLAKHIDLHVARTHRKYVKVDILTYELRKDE